MHQHASSWDSPKSSTCHRRRFFRIVIFFFPFSSQLISRDWYVLEWSNINEAARVRMSSISCPALAALTVVFWTLIVSSDGRGPFLDTVIQYRGSKVIFWPFRGTQPTAVASDRFYDAVDIGYTLRWSLVSLIPSTLIQREVIETCLNNRWYRCEDGRSPVSASCVTISNLDLFSSSSTGVNPGIRSWRKHLPDWARCQKAIGGICFTKKWRAEILQPDLEFDNFKPWLESSIFKCISWLNG